MRSLADHLVEGADHGRLPFHPGCPLCRRERLCGPVPAGAVVPQRARAALVAALLAAGSGGLSQSGGALAADDPGGISDKDLDNLVKGIQEDDGPPSKDTTDPPEGESTDDTVPGGPDDEPAGDEPAIPGADDPAGEAQAVGGSLPSQAPAAVAQPAPSPPVQPVPSLPAQPVPPPAQPVPPPLQPAAPVEPAAAPVRRAAPSIQRAPAARWPAGVAPPHATKTPPPVVPATDPAPARAEQSAPEQQGTSRPAAPAQVPSTRGVKVAPPCSSDRGDTHVVRAGDSLWAIASASLGAEASTAAIARRVARLWELNSDRIASGEPDLLVPGECLLLPGP